MHKIETHISHAGERMCCEHGHVTISHAFILCKSHITFHPDDHRSHVHLGCCVRLTKCHQSDVSRALLSRLWPNCRTKREKRPRIAFVQFYDFFVHKYVNTGQINLKAWQLYVPATKRRQWQKYRFSCYSKQSWEFPTWSKAKLWVFLTLSQFRKVKGVSHKKYRSRILALSCWADRSYKPNHFCLCLSIDVSNYKLTPRWCAMSWEDLRLFSSYRKRHRGKSERGTKWGTSMQCSMVIKPSFY